MDIEESGWNNGEIPLRIEKLKQDIRERFYEDESKMSKERIIGKRLNPQILINGSGKTSKSNIYKNTAFQIGTWNIRSLKEKGVELSEEFDKAHFEIFVITETVESIENIAKDQLYWSKPKTE